MDNLDSIKKEFDKKWNSNDFSELTMCDDGSYRVLESPAKIWAFFEKKMLVTGATSDGYHTFDELYEHRVTLFIKLCEMMLTEWNYSKGSDYIWRSKLHSDGSAFDGWFIMGIFKRQGKQITYHLPIDRWEDTDFAQTLDRSPVFDGHTHRDVLARLTSLLP